MTATIICQKPKKEIHNDGRFSQNYQSKNFINIGKSMELISYNLKAYAEENGKVNSKNYFTSKKYVTFKTTARILLYILNAQIKDAARKGDDELERFLHEQATSEHFFVKTDNHTLGKMARGGVSQDFFDNYKEMYEKVNSEHETDVESKKRAETDRNTNKGFAKRHRKRLEEFGMIVGTEYKSAYNHKTKKWMEIDWKSKYTILISKDFVVPNHPDLELFIKGEQAPKDEPTPSNPTVLIDLVSEKKSIDNQLVKENEGTSCTPNPKELKNSILLIKSGEPIGSEFFSNSIELKKEKKSLGGRKNASERWNAKRGLNKDKRQTNVTQHREKNPVGEQVMMNFLVALLENFRNLMWNGKSFDKKQVPILLKLLIPHFKDVQTKIMIERQKNLKDMTEKYLKKHHKNVRDFEIQRLTEKYKVWFEGKYHKKTSLQLTFEILQNAGDWAFNYVQNSEYYEGWFFSPEKWLDIMNPNGLKGAIEKTMQSYCQNEWKNSNKGDILVSSSIVLKVDKSIRKVLSAYATELPYKYNEIKLEQRKIVYALITSDEAKKVMSVEERTALYRKFLDSLNFVQ